MIAEYDKHMNQALLFEHRKNYMFVWVFSSLERIFHSYGDITIAGIELQILTYAPHPLPMSSEGFLACHSYWETGLRL